MEKNRGWVILAILLLVLVLLSAATMHWHYVGALLLAGLALFLSHLAFSILAKDVPDDAVMNEIRDALWSRGIGANFPTWPERASGMGHNIVEQKPAEAERLIAYVDRALDRQINKARGILPFNSLIMALMGLEKNRFPGAIQWDDSLSDITLFGIFFVIVGLAISSFFCLELFWVHWGKPESYAEFQAEYRDSMAMLGKRSRILAKCIIISATSTLVAIGVIGFTEIIGT